MTMAGVGLLRRFIRETLEDQAEDELSALEPGDRIDVMSDRFQDLVGVRVVRQFDQADRETETGYGDDTFLDGVPFDGPGVVVQTGDGEEVAVPLDHVVPGSKAKYYFPDDEVDAYGRDVPNPYRRMADRDALGHIERG
jgi:hypothetical protein